MTMWMEDDMLGTICQQQAKQRQCLPSLTPELWKLSVVQNWELQRGRPNRTIPVGAIARWLGYSDMKGCLIFHCIRL